jgi:hypothetical protein
LFSSELPVGLIGVAGKSSIEIKLLRRISHRWSGRAVCFLDPIEILSEYEHFTFFSVQIRSVQAPQDFLSCERSQVKKKQGGLIPRAYAWRLSAPGRPRALLLSAASDRGLRAVPSDRGSRASCQRSRPCAAIVFVGRPKYLDRGDARTGARPRPSLHVGSPGSPKDRKCLTPGVPC